ncbi:hypothetical protein F5Y14DRAFT_405326, partial [Nemania sp. NC0429]
MNVNLLLIGTSRSYLYCLAAIRCCVCLVVSRCHPAHELNDFAIFSLRSGLNHHESCAVTGHPRLQAPPWIRMSSDN